MARLPTGTVTFLFTDIEGSTRAWIRDPDGMRAALVLHDELIEKLTKQYGGHVVRPRGEGDSRFVVFDRATNGVAAACAMQVGLVNEAWALEAPLRVRMALHTGEADVRTGDYYGPAVNHCARLRAVAHGAQVLVSSVTADLVRESLAGEISLRDMGEQQLKDLERPEHVWQLVHPGLPTEFPPLSSRRVRHDNLPAEATSFVGREELVRVLSARLGARDVRLITLTGAGGIGKTRVAVRVAREILKNFADGVCFVSLAQLDQPTEVISTIAQTLGIHEIDNDSPRVVLRDHLQTKDLLLILDSFEHVLPAGTSMSELLDTCSGLSIIVTSRAVLGVAQEHVFDVPPLDTADASPTTDPETLGHLDAVKLFCHRATAAQAEFALTQQNVSAIAEICRHLDGLPLAIELAAARIRVLGPAALLHRLSGRLALLSTGTRDVPVRHQTLRAAIAWSYDLLSSDERRLLDQVAIFESGFTMDAVEALPAASGKQPLNVLDGIGALVDKSLLRRLDGVDGKQQRYALLETIREFALERLAISGDEQATRDAHAHYFRGLAEEAQSHLAILEQATWLAMLDNEHDNLRAALRWEIKRGATATALELSAALYPLWVRRGYMSEGRNCLVEVLNLHPSHPAEIAETRKRARVLNGAGNLAWLQGDVATALSLLNDSLAIRKSLGDQTGIAWSLNGLGEVARLQGDYKKARSLFEESLASARTQDDHEGVASFLNSLGNVARLQADYDTARSMLEESLALHRTLGDHLGMSFALARLAEIERVHRHYIEARALAEESLAIAGELGDHLGVATSLASLGDTAHHSGDDVSARALYEQSLAIRRRIGNRRGVAVSLLRLAEVDIDQGDYAGAESLIDESLTIGHQLDNPHYIAGALEALAGAAIAASEPSRAIKLVSAATRIRSSAGAPRSPIERGQLRRRLTKARSLVDADTAATAWTEGQAMGIAEAVAYAHHRLDRPEHHATLLQSSTKSTPGVPDLNSPTTHN